MCQTRIEAGRQRPPQAFERTSTWIDAATTSRRFDLWCAWRSLGALHDAAPHLPEDFDGFWIDVVAQADPAHAERYVEWARTLRGGQIKIQTLDLERQAEVVCGLDGEPAWPVDHDALDPRLRGRAVPRGVVAFAEQGVHGRGDVRRALAAARVRAAYERLGHIVDGCPELDVSALRPRWAEIDAYVPRVPWATLPEPVDATPQAVQLQSVDGVPDGIRARLEGQSEGRLAVFRAWLGLLDDLDVVVVRCTGSLRALEEMLDALDLRDHPERPNTVFGMTTVGHDALDEAARDALLGLATGAADWGLRWSDLRWRLQDRDPSKPDDSFYVVRTERRQTYDNLIVSLDTDDPDDEGFRRARRELARMVHDDLAQAAAWHFEGAPVTTERGRRFEALAASLRGEVDAVLDAPIPVSPKGPRLAPAPLIWLHRLVTRGPGKLDVTGAAQRALQETVPGFRHDRRAHATDLYFIDFVRATPHGFQYVQIERTHKRPGHRVRVGVSRYRARPDDLDPGVGRAAHGLVIRLEALVPERSTLWWTYTTRRDCEAAMADMATLVAARAGPFFERADAHLAKLAEEDL